MMIAGWLASVAAVGLIAQVKRIRDRGDLTRSLFVRYMGLLCILAMVGIASTQGDWLTDTARNIAASACGVCGMILIGISGH
jgi:uncharacterized membrane protein